MLVAFLRGKTNILFVPYIYSISNGFIINDEKWGWAFFLMFIYSYFDVKIQELEPKYSIWIQFYIRYTRFAINRQYEHFAYKHCNSIHVLCFFCVWLCEWVSECANVVLCANLEKASRHCFNFVCDGLKKKWKMLFTNRFCLAIRFFFHCCCRCDSLRCDYIWADRRTVKADMHSNPHL